MGRATFSGPIRSTAGFEIGTTAIDATALELNRVADLSTRLVDSAAATLALTVAAHADRTVLVNRAAGQTITLPAALGTGAKFRVLIQTTLTSGSLIIQVANATDVMRGVVQAMSDDPATMKGWQAAATSDTITLNRTTTGVASAGEWFEFEDYAAGFWAVRGVFTQSGAEATPFSAAVA